MKTTKAIAVIALMSLCTNVSAQDIQYGEQYGHTLNAGIGLGYYGYLPGGSPSIHFNYEFDVMQNFTVAPFITAMTYRDYRTLHGFTHPDQRYYYRETIIPIGAKASYYFDDMLNASSKWDFYMAASLGFVLQKTVWQAGYTGDRNVSRKSDGLYLDGHIGAEYHLTPKTGLQLDLSSGISTFCVAIHL